jgi:CHAD domain-containing protein
VAYRLKRGESVTAGVKRIASEELGDAIDSLRAGQVHEARKRLKKTRALLRLMRGELGATYRAENARLREIGRKLSPVRDAEAMLETLDRAAEQRTAVRKLRPVLLRYKERVEKQADIGVLGPKLVDALNEARRDVRRWPLNGGGFDVVEGGVEAAYRRGRKALAEYLRTGRREDEHEWRKRVKDHWYHVRLLEDLWTGDAKEYERSLKDLEDALGEDLNLAMVREHVGKNDGIARAIDAEQFALRDQALKVGERLYAPKPKKAMKKLRQWWR